MYTFFFHLNIIASEYGSIHLFGLTCLALPVVPRSPVMAVCLLCVAFVQMLFACVFISFPVSGVHCKNIL